MSETTETAETNETREKAEKAARSRKAKRSRDKGAEAEREAIAILARHGVPVSRSASAQASRFTKRTGQQQPDLVVADGHPLAGRLWVEVKASPSQSVVWEGLRQACASGKPVFPLVMWRRPGGHGKPVRWLCATTGDTDGPFESLSKAIARLDAGGDDVEAPHAKSRAGLCWVFTLGQLKPFLELIHEFPPDEPPSLHTPAPKASRKRAPQPELAPATITTPATSADRYALIVGRMADAGWTFATLGEIMGCSRANAAARAKAWSQRTDADTVARVGALFGLTADDWAAGVAVSSSETPKRSVAAARYLDIPAPKNRPADPTRCGPKKEG